MDTSEPEQDLTITKEQAEFWLEQGYTVIYDGDEPVGIVFDDEKQEQEFSEVYSG